MAICMRQILELISKSKSLEFLDDKDRKMHRVCLMIHLACSLKLNLYFPFIDLLLLESNERFADFDLDIISPQCFRIVCKNVGIL